jgi:hypothetical protein
MDKDKTKEIDLSDPKTNKLVANIIKKLLASDYDIRKAIKNIK